MASMHSVDVLEPPRTLLLLHKHPVHLASGREGSVYLMTYVAVLTLSSLYTFEAYQ